MVTDKIASVLQSKGKEIHSVPPATTVYDALAVMAEKEVAALLVMSDGGRLDGIVSTRDYGRKVVLRGKTAKNTRVRDVMTTALTTASPEMTVGDGIRIMTEGHFRHLPVMEAGKLIGVVSMGDLARAVISGQADTIDHLHSYIGMNYPA